MAYLVLARKYRPQKFSEVVGQRHVVRTLQNALKSGKLSHALLFAGIKGTGKTTVARIVAKALNCESPEKGYEPCNKCLHCIEINKGIYVDVIEIDAASNRGIDQIRELIENLKFAPAKGKAKVYIIDEAHMLTKEASNALLKTLEEPPSHVYFILATTEPNKLLPTILSRCQRYDFRRLELPLLLKHLKWICEKEKYEIEEEALELIATEAQGSLRDALSLLDQAMAYGSRTKEDIIQAFGWHENILVEELAAGLLKKDIKKTFEIAEKIYNQGTDIVFLTEKLTDFFRELLLMKAFQRDTGFTFSLSTLRALSLEYQKEEIFLILQTLARDLETIKRSDYPRLHFELSLMRICEFEKLTPIKNIISRLEELINAGINFEPVKEEKEERTWENFLKVLEKEGPPSLYALLTSIKKPLITEREIVVKITLPEESLHSVEIIKKRIEDFFQKPVKIEVEKQKVLKTHFIEEIKNRDEVKNVINILGAKISHIEVKDTFKEEQK